MSQHRMFSEAMDQLHAPDDLYERVTQQTQTGKPLRRGTARPITAIAVAVLIGFAAVGGTAYAVVNTGFFQAALGNHGLGGSSRWADPDTNLSYRRDYDIVSSAEAIRNYENAVEPVNYTLEANGYTLNIIDMVIDENACGIVRFTLDCPTGLGISDAHGIFNELVFDMQVGHLSSIGMKTRSGSFLDMRSVYDAATLTDTHLEGAMYFTPIWGTFDTAKDEILDGVQWQMSWSDGKDLHLQNMQALTDFFTPTQMVETRRFTHGPDAVADVSPFSIHYIADKQNSSEFVTDTLELRFADGGRHVVEDWTNEPQGESTVNRYVAATLGDNSSVSVFSSLIDLEELSSISLKGRNVSESTGESQSLTLELLPE